VAFKKHLGVGVEEEGETRGGKKVDDGGKFKLLHYITLPRCHRVRERREERRDPLCGGVNLSYIHYEEAQSELKLLRKFSLMPVHNARHK
jgi:hypothetical protein